MMNTMLLISLVLLSLAVIACLYRLLKGPSLSDRIAALDAIGIFMLSIIAIFCMLLRTNAYFDIILVIGVLTFLGTTAFARYIERGVIIDDGDHQSDR